MEKRELLLQSWQSFRNILAILLFTALSGLRAQTSITIKPTPTTSQSAYVYDFAPTSGYPTGLHINAGYNTVGGTPSQSRSYIRFDLSQIPTGSVIVSARLNLFNDPTIGTHQGMGSNDTKLSIVNQAWNQNTITWNVQPTVSAANEVIVGPTTTDTSSITNIDVSAPVQYWVNNPSLNLGWRFWQLTEGGTLHRVEDFASSWDTTAPTKVPYLVITYQAACADSLIIQADTTGIQFAYMYDYTPTTAYDYGDHFNAGYNTISGTPTQARTYVQFDLSQIPSGATVTDASFSLYIDPNINSSSDPGHNATKLSIVTSAWNQSTITWNQQPTVDTTTNEVIVGPTTTATSSITGINVTAPVQFWVSNPGQNYGWRFWQVSEYTTLHSVEDFASKYDTSASYRPKLIVRYTCPTGIANTTSEPSISIYPNPTDNILFIRDAASGNFAVEVFNVLGQKVIDETSNNGISTRSLMPGTYLLHYTDISTKKTTVLRFIKM